MGLTQSLYRATLRMFGLLSLALGLGYAYLFPCVLSCGERLDWTPVFATGAFMLGLVLSMPRVTPVKLRDPAAAGFRMALALLWPIGMLCTIPVGRFLGFHFTQLGADLSFTMIASVSVALLGGITVFGLLSGRTVQKTEPVGATAA